MAKEKGDKKRPGIKKADYYEISGDNLTRNQSKVFTLDFPGL